MAKSLLNMQQSSRVLRNAKLNKIQKISKSGTKHSGEGTQNSLLAILEMERRTFEEVVGVRRPKRHRVGRVQTQEKNQSKRKPLVGRTRTQMAGPLMRTHKCPLPAQRGEALGR